MDRSGATYMGVCSSNSKRVDAHSLMPILRPWCRVNGNLELCLFEWDPGIRVVEFDVRRNGFLFKGENSLDARRYARGTFRMALMKVRSVMVLVNASLERWIVECSHAIN